MGNFDASRFKAAREETGLTQEAFARSLGLSAEFISLLESGKRAPSLTTLSRIAAFLKRDMGDFLPSRETTFAVLFRAAGPASLIRDELAAFQRYAEDYLRLEELTGRRLASAPLYASLSGLNGARLTPARLAAEERRRLGLGDEPVRDIFALLERSGLRILRMPLPAEACVSGVFIHLDDRDASFALINSTQTVCRQAFTAAHEYCHYLRDRHSAPVIDGFEIFAACGLGSQPGAHNATAAPASSAASALPDSVPESSATPVTPESATASTSAAAPADAGEPAASRSPTPHPEREQFAQEFAAHFLMPPLRVLDFVESEIGSGGGRRLSFDDVLLAKRYFGVSAQAMLRTLRDLDLLTAAEFKDYLARDPAPRERAVFGDTDEEWEGAPGSIVKADESGRGGREGAGAIVSDRYRLLKSEAEAGK
ncbi:MAG: helix-turn-helix domain-containing protein [Acidobacteriota bacterium]|nr:helix-turn-helix domain-containing protein [Acidobacteriota bacterium]